jgi:hypothetical protein
MNHALQLPPFIGSNPLGALSAFGLLKVLNQADAPTTLRWSLQDDWIAEIGSPLITTDELIEWMTAWFAARGDDDLNWTSDDIRVPPDDFRQVLEGTLNGNPALASKLQAQAADGAIDKSKGLIKPSALYMVSGQQSFLDNLRAIRRTLLDEPMLWREALAGPWEFRTRLHSLGWDPATERLHGLRARAPTAEKASCVAGAVWLAYEAMELLPALSISGREHTTGFDRSGWTWPLSDTALGLGATKALLQARPEQWTGRAGIAAVLHSERYSFGQGYAVFRPAHPLQPEPHPRH